MNNTSLKYQDLIAPCGMNCGICIGHLREKRPCGGCYKKDDENKPEICRSCLIVNCELLTETESGFCYDCEKYPCARLKRLDKRYRTKYGMSMIENLEYIQNNGLEKFLLNEEKRWTCKLCGSGLCVHRNYCLNCNTMIRTVLLFLLIIICNLSIAQLSSSGYVLTGKDSIYYEASGNGKVIILIHDGLIHREVWENQFTFFAKNNKVIRYDRRGYGKSSPAVGPYSHLEDLNTLYSQLKIDSACLIACSSGGALAIDFTLKYPQKVSSLILVGAVVGGFSYTSHFNTRGGHLPADFKDNMDQRIYYASDDPYEIYYKNTSAKTKTIELVKNNPQRVYNRPIYTPQPVPAYRRLNEIKIPALILVGEFDIPDVHAHAGAINAGILNSKRIIIPKSGHLIPIEQPDSFNEIVLDFLNNLSE